MNISKLTTETKRQLLKDVGEYLICMSEEDEDRMESELDALVEYYLDPLSGDDFFGTEGWEEFFGLYD